MKRFVKTWLLWMLMLALPVQAQISVVQVSCELGHQRQTGGHTVKLGHAALVKAAPRAKRQKPALAQHGSKQLKKTLKMAAQDAEQQVCDPCVTCCGATLTLPNLNDTPAPWELSEYYLAVRPISHVGYIPEGLERPPRSTLA